MVHVAIADDLADRLDQLAQKRGVTLEVVVNETLAQAVEETEREAARRRVRELLDEQEGTLEEEEAVALALEVKRSA